MVEDFAYFASRLGASFGGVEVVGVALRARVVFSSMSGAWLIDEDGPGRHVAEQLGITATVPRCAVEAG